LGEKERKVRKRKKENKWIGRKREEGEQKGRSKGNGLGEREKKEQKGRSKKWIGRKGKEGEQGRCKGNGLGEREMKVSKKERSKEMDWEKGGGR
jgi:hypothetical protein